jgi:hypothetical protein
MVDMLEDEAICSRRRTGRIGGGRVLLMSRAAADQIDWQQQGFLDVKGGGGSDRSAAAGL